MIRKPVVAGQFYPGTKNELEEMIDYCVQHKYGPGNQTQKDEEIYGIICPHAGYVYSGPTACHSYKAISSKNPELVIILGPNHFGVGKDVATMTNAQWETPLGLVEVDSEAAQKIANESEYIEIDEFSHSKDHSLEVQIPMLQSMLSNKFKILPIILRDQSLEMAKDVGNAVAQIAKSKNTMIVASSDFTHYEENSFAHSQDKSLIEPILEMNVEKFYNVLIEKRVTACGYGAIGSVLIACKKLGATKGELLSYSTSGDVMGDTSSVVGYGAIKFI
ncbi:AmmeMemoRadiSam system protein B [Candidatus Nitrosopumilus sp. SW]|uniref:AmmeMemoRadiSam system protein B n=1 Tax=Candidatus Nitrosopumilus sp. SW TaxID=2508726 RepID=UPI00114EA51A|nr:AmmeMemoRadiSam system protein B [Candidatus Nitrosopumilus sp. SW]QDI88722.1 AmmeMemoRadiSam system protein B [Candidatus Nitrosopumilus sp. SW]